MAVASDLRNEGSFSGTTPQQIVPPAPPGHKLVVTSMKLINEDNAAVTFTLKIRRGRHVRRMDHDAAAGDTLVYSSVTLEEMEIHENGELTAELGGSADPAPTYEAYWRMVRL